MAVSPDLDTQIHSLLQSGADLSQVLVLMRKRDLSLAETSTRDRMVKAGRCPVCTLRLPCRHYQTAGELPQPLASSRSGNQSLDVPEKEGLSVRYRSVNGASITKEVRHPGVKQPAAHRKRLRLLEKLDRYREEKLRKDIERLEKEQKAEEQRLAEAENRERRRRERMEQLRKTLRNRSSDDQHALSPPKRSAKKDLNTTLPPLPEPAIS